VISVDLSGPEAGDHGTGSGCIVTHAIEPVLAFHQGLPLRRLRTTWAPADQSQGPVVIARP